eukprot:6213267-Pleurochrysis_carterae.AAC.3
MNVADAAIALCFYSNAEERMHHFRNLVIYARSSRADALASGFEPLAFRFRHRVLRSTLYLKGEVNLFRLL